MARKRKTQDEILAEMEARPDGLRLRRVGIWTLEKLAILMLYFHGFTSASAKAGGGVYVDGLAGPGLAEIRGARARPGFVWGSPLLALRTQPPFAKCILVELNAGNVEALRERARLFGDRAVVRAGDVNRILPQLMRDEVHALSPCFCLLDPEGTELSWSTIKAVALTPKRRLMPELLVLFPSSWLMRLLPRKGLLNPRHEAILDSMLPGPGWREIYEQRLRNRIEPSDAKDRYVEMYRQGLENLGYRAFSHPIRAPSRPSGRRRERYQLIFATQHAAGEAIMLDVFTRPYVLDFPVSVQRPLFEA